MINGKLEITIKINEFPDAINVENNWKKFNVSCDEIVVTIIIKPKVWKKFTDAQTTFPQWVAAISGTKGEDTDDGFILNNPSIQIFEKKVKEDKSNE